MFLTFFLISFLVLTYTVKRALHKCFLKRCRLILEGIVIELDWRG